MPKIAYIKNLFSTARLHIKKFSKGMFCAATGHKMIEKAIPTKIGWIRGKECVLCKKFKRDKEE